MELKIETGKGEKENVKSNPHIRLPIGRISLSFGSVIEMHLLIVPN